MEGKQLKSWISTEPKLDGDYLHLPNWYPPLNSKHQIMHNWETPLMAIDAKQICSKGGSILNIGYGMGIIDRFIRDYNPKKHTIIEVHPLIADNAIKEGFKNVLVGDWYDIVKGLDETFDAIYFDTFCFDNRPDWKIFAKYHVDRLLKPGGIFSYFNRGAAKKQGVEDICRKMGWNKRTITIDFIENKETKQYESISWHK
tara:strand:+ start:2135 stop:2734 length:600 start_codon:yes stop_codon:yes gene_type:complete